MLVHHAKRDREQSTWILSEMAFDAKRRLGIPRQFGRLGAYWLDGNPDW
ncbi:hypothetical protein ACFX5Q_11895 [Mesorhizobium sp. IMUNJ 23033]